jgi:hypothetical protein
MNRRHKYNAKRTEYGGHTYDSKAEARYAERLDLLRMATDKAVRVANVIRQPRWDLPGGIVYKADFEVTYADGRMEWVDVKGFETPVFRLKMKLMKAAYPKVVIKIVK